MKAFEIEGWLEGKPIRRVSWIGSHFTYFDPGDDVWRGPDDMPSLGDWDRDHLFTQDDWDVYIPTKREDLPPERNTLRIGSLVVYHEKAGALYPNNERSEFAAIVTHVYPDGQTCDLIRFDSSATVAIMMIKKSIGTKYGAKNGVVTKWSWPSESGTQP